VVIARLQDPLEDVAEGDVGEILVAAPWMFDGYDQRWTENAATTVYRSGRRFHRTGDVGYLHNGNLFHLGRLRHVIWTPTGPLSSVAVEQPIEVATGWTVASVGIGPRDAQVIAVVVGGTGKLRLAAPDVAASARAASAHPIAAVLTGALPLDRRHRSKIDRTTLARDANRLLSGR
jgi:acyl-CoA synthetase (AMP-forming)/AMP-acid ligase II